MATLKKEQCGCCKYWLAFDDSKDVGSCRFNAPVIGLNGAIHPNTSLSWWCGEWRLDVTGVNDDYGD